MKGAEKLTYERVYGVYSTSDRGWRWFATAEDACRHAIELLKKPGATITIEVSDRPES